MIFLNLIMDIYFQHRIDSVMNQAALFGEQEASEAVFWAEKQTGGRGRHGRVWASPEGGLYCSILLRPDWPVRDISKMTLLAAVAVCEAVREIADVPAKIKWPNDILINGEKLAGILTESSIKGSKVEHVIVGIGVNVNSASKDLVPGAVTLKELTGREYDLKDFLNVILKRFEYWYEGIRESDFPAMLNRWRELSCTLGAYIEVEEGAQTVRGRAVDIDDHGALVIEDDNGKIIKKTGGIIA